MALTDHDGSLGNRPGRASVGRRGPYYASLLLAHDLFETGTRPDRVLRRLFRDLALAIAFEQRGVEIERRLGHADGRKSHFSQGPGALPDGRMEGGVERQDG